MTARDGWCVNTSYHGSNPPRAVDGAYLCEGCVGWLRRALAALPALHAELDDALHGSTVTGSGRVSGTPEDPMPGNVAAAAHQTQIVGVLAWLTGRVSRDRGLAGPSLNAAALPGHDPACPGQSAVASARVRLQESEQWLGEQQRAGQALAADYEAVVAAGARLDAAIDRADRDGERWSARSLRCTYCGWESGASPAGPLAEWLDEHVDWLAAQPFVDEVVTRVRPLSGRAHGLLDPASRSRSEVVALCPEDGCEGSLWALLTNDGLLPALLQCDAEPEHNWPFDRPGAWLALGRRLHTEHKEAKEAS